MYVVNNEEIAEDLEESNRPPDPLSQFERFRGFSFINVNHLANVNTKRK